MIQRLLLFSLFSSVGVASASPTLIFEGGEAVDLSETVPDVVAPSIGTGTCMGVATGAFAVSGIGLAGGTSITDEECQIRYNSVRLDELGEKDAAKQIMCLIPTARLALEVSGYQCLIDIEFLNKQEKQQSNYELLMGG